MSERGQKESHWIGEFYTFPILPRLHHGILAQGKNTLCNVESSRCGAQSMGPVTLFV